MRHWAPLLWYGLIFATSCMVIFRDSFVAAVGGTLPSSARPGWATLWDHYWWLFVKGWHATEFAILFCLVRKSVGDLGWSLFLASFAAVLDEYHQTFVPGRGGVVSDVLIDIGGVCAAAAVLTWQSTTRLSDGDSLSLEA